MLDEKVKTLLYDACSSNDYKTFRENLIFSEINTPLDDQGNTALHIATLHGHAEIVRLLLRYHSNRAVENNEGKLADQMIPNDEIKAIFQAAYRPSPTATGNHYVGDTPEIEWIDTYRNAYRIAFENHEHMKRWITKVPLNELLEEILNNYVEKMTFNTEKCRDEVKTYLDYAIDEGEPLYLVNIYTGTSLFCSKLNEDLAKLGSDFRFVSTRLDYPDNEPPKDLGQYIYASLLINHRVFRKFQHASTTFRGMKLLEDDLEQYGKNKVVITRSFLSTSKDRDVAEIYMKPNKNDNRLSVICEYKVSNPRSSLSIESVSNFPEEQEVLIVPFVAFQITDVRDVKHTWEGKEYLLREIKLVECGPNPT